MEELLREIRKSPRKMQKKYLLSCGILQYIDQQVPCDWNPKQKIDYILSSEKTICLCGNPAKSNSKWCSITCKNKDPVMRNMVGKKNSQNKESRTLAMKRTLMERYGVDSVQSIPTAQKKTKEKKQSYYKDVIESTFKEYKLDIDKYSDITFLTEICSNSSYSELKESHFNGMPVTTINRHFLRIGFDPSFNKSSSKGERELCDYINQLGFRTNSNDRTLIKPKELDIVIPSKRIAIEYNGLFWHADEKNRHREKTDLCFEKGYSLLHVFEDEWQLKQDIVKSIISSKLGVNKTIGARNCQIVQVSQKDASIFLERTHIQGSINGKHIGLKHDNKLIAIMSIGRNRYGKGMEILRFSSELFLNVAGAFSKLLKEAKRLFGIDRFYSYADLRFSDGNVYSKNGGTLIRTTGPGYFWIDKKTNQRISRYRTQKSKLASLLGENYDPALSETKNMENAGYHRIWDCGHKLFLM